MIPEPDTRWLRIAGYFTLALAALVALYAWRQAGEEQRRREDIRTRADETMARIEAEARRMENAAGATE